MNKNLNKVKLKDSRNSYWRQVPIGEFVDFNPSESLQGGVEAKKIPMAMVKEFQRKIVGFEISNFNSGPKFRNGDTLVAKITPCLENGKTAFVDILEEGEVAFGSTEFIVLRENPNSNREFIYYLARSPLFREKAIKCMEGTSGRKRVNEGALKRQEILIPDLPTQQKIAKVLSDLDAKIEVNNRINAELEAMAKLVYEYWFVQFDFPVGFDSAQPPGTAQDKPKVSLSGVEGSGPSTSLRGLSEGYKSSGGKMVWNKELKREIPEGWRSGTADEIFEFNPSLSIPKGIVAKYLDMNSIPQKGFMTLKPEDKEFNGGVKFQNGDVVVARITPCLENGKTGLITQLEGNEVGFGSTEFIVIRGKEMKLSGFASFLARSDSFRNFAIGNMTGTSGRKRVDAKTLKEYILPIPDQNILKEFEAFTSSIFQKQTINIKQNQELSMLRDWLLPMLMNGQVRVD